MKIHILTLFPGMFDSFVSHSILKRSLEKKLVEISVVNLRDFTHDRHKTCDDRPFGGGPGMLMKPEPIFEALEQVLENKKPSKKTRVIYLTPQGKPFTQSEARRFLKADELVFICGHYEGIDERVVDEWVTDEVSIGDYVLTQGELPAMVVIDTVTRLIPGVLGSDESKVFESFTQNLLEYPQYTRPAVYRDLKVPQVLLSGDHKKIAEWRHKQAELRTKRRRPDLLKKAKKS